MRTSVAELGLRPYEDGSGFREEVAAKWVRDGDKDIAAQVEIKQGEQRLVFTFEQWREFRHAVDEAIADTGWVVPVTNG